MIRPLRQLRRQKVVSSSTSGTQSCKDLREANAPAAKPGQKTLVQLDHYRYTDAPTLFTLKKPSRPMRLEDVKNLVEWKLSVLGVSMGFGGVFQCSNSSPASPLPLPVLAV